jgi:hypothetical protein
MALGTTSSPSAWPGSATCKRARSRDARASAPQSEAAAEDLPHRRKYLLLVTGFMRRLFELHLELIDEVERELAPAAPD